MRTQELPLKNNKSVDIYFLADEKSRLNKCNSLETTKAVAKNLNCILVDLKLNRVVRKAIGN